jgi:MFS family permease
MSTKDVVLLFISRSLRLTSFGVCSVILSLYLNALGFDDLTIGGILTGTLLGDVFISLPITQYADSFGRRWMLIIGCFLHIGGGIGLALIHTPFLIGVLIATIIGVISPSGNEVGPFLSLEQSMLADAVPLENRTYTFAWYNMVGNTATAIGSLLAGLMIDKFIGYNGASRLDLFRILFAAYGAIGFFMLINIQFLTISTEAKKEVKSINNSEKQPLIYVSPSESQHVEEDIPYRGYSSKKAYFQVVQCCMMFFLDAFGGGLVNGTLMVYYFHQTYQMNISYLGAMMFGANLIAGISALVASYIVKYLGVVKTMVFTHVPSNVLLALVPFMPDEKWAVACLLARFSISQMDTAPRTTFITSIVKSQDRTKATGVINVVRTLSSAIAATLTGYLASSGRFGWAFVLSGGLKLVYDIIFFFVASKMELH